MCKSGQFLSEQLQYFIRIKHHKFEGIKYSQPTKLQST